MSEPISISPGGISPAGKPFWRRQERAIVLFILLAAAMFRGLFLHQIKGGVVFHTYMLEHLDNNFFYNWARGIHAGDWLTGEGYHPYHFWHKRFGTEEEWRSWYGGPQFHQAPLYPYLLALLFAAGGSVIHLVLFQALSGVFQTLLIYLVARRLFSARAAFAAAILSLFYGPFYLYESQVLRTTLATVGGMLVLYLCLRNDENDRGGGWFALGLLSGVLILLKEGFLFCFGAILIWLVLSRRPVKSLLKSFIFVVAGVAICFIPLAARNQLVGAPLFSLSSVGPVTFTFGNASDVSGLQFETSRYTREIMIRTRGAWRPTIALTLKTHRGSVASILEQAFGKFVAFWDGYETPNNANYYYAKLHSPFLKWCTFSFSLIAPAAIIGLVLSRKNWRRLLLLYLYLASVIGQVVLFYHLSRFRLAAVPVLLIFAGYAFDEILAALRRENKTGGLIMAALGLLLYAVLSRQESVKRRIPITDYLIVAVFYANYYAYEGNFEIAFHELDLAEKIFPDYGQLIAEYRKDFEQLQREGKPGIKYSVAPESVLPSGEKGRRPPPPSPSRDGGSGRAGGPPPAGGSGKPKSRN